MNRIHKASFCLFTFILIGPSGGLIAQQPVKTAADFGITANSQEDQTASVQKYLDSVAAAGGGAAFLPPGFYPIQSTLTIPTGVALQGSWEAPHHGILTVGTVLQAFAGRGSETGPAFLELQPSSAVKGITIVYPQQKLADIQPYPWTIHGQGMHHTIENVTLVNSYQGLCLGPEWNELHLIRNVYGCVLRRGVLIDNCTDIGRIENVHFNPHYWTRSGHDGVPKDAKPNPDIAIAIEMQKRLEAFTFKRTDWQYVHNTFVFGAKIGYLFTESDHKAGWGDVGGCNGQFHGIGADMCQYGAVFEKTQPWGVEITDGQFVTGPFSGDSKDDHAAIWTKKTFEGSVQLANCCFWGYFTNVLRLEGNAFVTLNQGTINEVKNSGVCMEILAGRAVINQTLFRSNPELGHIHVGPDVQRILVTENFAPGGVKIASEAKEKLILRDNE